MWQNSVFWVHLRKLQNASFLDCVLLIAKVFSMELLELFGVMVWAVWGKFCSRCYSVYNDEGSLDIEWVFRFIEAFRNSNQCV